MPLKHPLVQRPPGQQAGATLIEALVALLVLALAIMGLTGLQLRTLAEARSSNAQAAAVQMAVDLLERMQVHRGLEPQVSVVPAYLVDFGPPPAGPDCFEQPCRAAALAAFQLGQWKGLLAQQLPGGDARVFRSPSDPQQLGVLIRWPHNAGAAEVDENGAGPGIPPGACPSGTRCHLAFIRP
jgi:type IV pilus assembly protein PilV